MQKKNKALFLDRDGVINIDHGYIYKPNQVDFIPKIFELVKLAKDHQFYIFIVTNQSGIGRGFFTKEDFLNLMDYFLKEFSKKKLIIDDYIFCPHKPSDNCICRKPSPYMINKLSSKYEIDKKESIFIGDKESDIDSAKLSGIGKIIRFQEKNHVQTLKEVQKFLGKNE